jgi:hypothetical protein
MIKMKKIKYVVDLSGCQTTNKNTTTNQKHAGMTKKRRDMRCDQGGVGGSKLIVLGQSSWGIV